MATYWCRPGAGGTNAGTQANPFNASPGALTAALTAATTDGDVILYHYTGQEELTVNTTFTFNANNVSIISVNMDSSDAPTAMDTNGWIGNSTTTYSIVLAAASRTSYVWGMTFRSSGGANGGQIQLTSSEGQDSTYEKCYFWCNKTAGSNSEVRTMGTGDVNSSVTLIDCTFRFGTAAIMRFGGRTNIIGGSISSAGNAVATVFNITGAADTSTCDLRVEGFDASAASATATLVNDTTIGPVSVWLSRCKLPSGAFTYLATQSIANLSHADVYVLDCSSDDTHGMFAYVNALGSMVSSTGVYVTAGAAAQSWKIDTSANVSFNKPFITPWIDLYHTGTSSITPYLDLIRDGSTTAYKADEVWGEFLAKTTTGTVLPTLYRDRATFTEEIGGTASDQATSALVTADWTGDTGAWFGKVDSGSAFTPAENGHIRARLCVGVNTSTTPIYLDPQIKT